MKTEARKIKAAEHHVERGKQPHSKTLLHLPGATEAARFWSAAVLSYHYPHLIAERLSFTFWAPCKSRRDRMFIDRQPPPHVFFLFFSGADRWLARGRGVFSAPLKNKKKYRGPFGL